jgi:Fungalysin/Thermolysin Propeptide Motif
MRLRLALAVATAAAAIGAASASASTATGPARVHALLRSARAPVSQLVRTRTVAFRGLRVERYRQRIDGLPVLGGEVTAISGPGEPPRIAADATAPLAARVAGGAEAPRISRERATGIARRARRVTALRVGARAHAVLAIDPARGSPAWRVDLPAARPFGDFEVLVDAASGRVLRSGNLLRRATGRARLYVPNPPAEQGSYAGIGSGRHADRHDRNTPRLTRLRRRVSLRRLKPGQDCLVGRYVKALLHRPPRAVCRRHRDWRRVKRHADAFEALMAYYHIDRTQAYVQSLGFTRANHSAIDARRQVAIADFRMRRGLGQDNSFYSALDRKIRYGYGGVDDAEDGDIVVHEYGHAMQDSQDRGFGCPTSVFCESGAIGEGFGDYVSAMMTLQTPRLPHPRRAAYCIFDWDGTARYDLAAAPCGRVADGSDGVETMPQAMTPGGICGGPTQLDLSIYCVGEVWTHGLIDLRLSPLVGQRLDVDLLASQFSYVNDETFGEAVDALVATDQAIYGGADVGAICAEMVAARGITGTTRCA